jgi:hypothetical protein
MKLLLSGVAIFLAFIWASVAFYTPESATKWVVSAMFVGMLCGALIVQGWVVIQVRSSR